MKKLALLLTAALVASIPAAAQHPSAVATVTAPAITVPGTITVGNNLRIAVPVNIQTASNATVTATSSDNTKVLVSSTLGGSGSSSVTFTNVSGGLTLYVDGIATSGTATVTLSATGYTNATSTVTLGPSGFAIMPIIPGAGASTEVVGFPDATLQICPFLLDGSNKAISATYSTSISPGVSTASVTVTSGSPSVGTIIGSPVSFAAGDSCHVSASLHPLSAGSSTVSISTPAGWSTPN